MSNWERLFKKWEHLGVCPKVYASLEDDQYLSQRLFEIAYSHVFASRLWSAYDQINNQVYYLAKI